MTIGEFLKNKRAEKNLSIQDVSFALKINPRVIKAIEDNVKEDLPATAISKGFIKSYARFLKVENIEELNALIESEFGTNQYRQEEATQNLEVNSYSSVKKFDSNSEDSIAKSISESIKSSSARDTKKIENSNNLKTPMMLVFAGIVLLLIVAVQKVITKYQKDSAQMAPEIATTEPPPTTSENNPLETNSTTPLTNPQSMDPAVANSTAEKQIPVTPLPPVETIESSVSNKTVDSSPTNSNTKEKEAPATTVEPAQAVSPAAEQFKMQNVEVIVEAKGDVEISYASKLSQIGKVKLKTGQIHVFKSKNGLKLIMNDGSLIRTAVNGVDKGLASTSSKPVTIVY